MAYIDVATGGGGFVSPWTDYDTTGQWGKVRFQKDAFGIVSVVGLIQASPNASGAATQTMFILPSGYRPGGAVKLLFMCWSVESGTEQLARIDVATDGTFIYQYGGRQWISLAGIAYYALA